MVPGVVARVLLGYPGWLLRCCYAVAKVPGVVARGLLCGFYVVAMVPGGGAKVFAMQLLGYSGWLVGYPGWLLRCCYAVARVLGVVGRVPGVVAKVLLCGC